MVNWKPGEEYPDLEALAANYFDKKHACVKNMVMYYVAAIILFGAVWFASREFKVLILLIVVLVGISVYCYLKFRSYAKVAKIIESGDFTWSSCRILGLNKRGWFDIGAGDKYTIMIEPGEWWGTDNTTVTDCELNKPAIVIKWENEYIATPIPAGKGYKQMRDLARANGRL